MSDSAACSAATAAGLEKNDASPFTPFTPLTAWSTTFAPDPISGRPADNIGPVRTAAEEEKEWIVTTSLGHAQVLAEAPQNLRRILVLLANARAAEIRSRRRLAVVIAGMKTEVCQLMNALSESAESSGHVGVVEALKGVSTDDWIGEQDPYMLACDLLDRIETVINETCLRLSQTSATQDEDEDSSSSSPHWFRLLDRLPLDPKSYKELNLCMCPAEQLTPVPPNPSSDATSTSNAPLHARSRSRSPARRGQIRASRSRSRSRSPTRQGLDGPSRSRSRSRHDRYRSRYPARRDRFRPARSRERRAHRRITPIAWQQTSSTDQSTNMEAANAASSLVPSCVAISRAPQATGQSSCVSAQSSTISFLFS